MTRDEKHALHCLKNRIKNDLKTSIRRYRQGTSGADILHGRMQGLQRVLMDMDYLGLIIED